MKPRLAVIGAGLGGSFLADALAEDMDVTVIELGTRSDQLQQRVVDVARPAITWPHVGSGPGGSTSMWHNGLIEIEEAVFQARWPFDKTELDPYYARAFHMLSGANLEDVRGAADQLRAELAGCGIPQDLLRQSLYYPPRRINAWKSLKLKGRVRLLAGEVNGFTYQGERIHSVLVKTADGTLPVEAEHFVLAAGGLGTPPLLQGLAATLPLPALAQVGRHYEDHPSGFVAEFMCRAPLYKLWNRPVIGSGGHLRLPMVIEQDGLRISFQIRPAVQFGPRNSIVSILSDLRNRPLHFQNYLRLFAHRDDILDILSLKFGLRIPTRHYSLLMVAEQRPSTRRSVWREQNSDRIMRDWVLPDDYIQTAQKAIERALTELGDRISEVRIFPQWQKSLFSSSHHSGTARMHISPEKGVCDGHGRVHGLENLFICDGSAIPASGTANTGLTIAALALRLAHGLHTGFFHPSSRLPVESGASMLSGLAAGNVP